MNLRLQELSKSGGIAGLPRRPEKSLLDDSYRFTSAQVTSVIDRSTNYCNLYNLYCGGNVGCQVAQTDLTAIPLDKKTSLGAGKNKFKCRSGKKREL